METHRPLFGGRASLVDEAERAVERVEDARWDRLPGAYGGRERGVEGVFSMKGMSYLL
jgi:hypothetical protein